MPATRWGRLAPVPAAAVALCLLAAGCSGTEEEVAAPPTTGDPAQVCEAWSVVEVELGDTPESAQRLVGALEAIRAAAPDELSFDAQTFLQAAVTATGVLEEAGYDPDAYGTLPPERQQEGAEASALLTRMRTGTIAFWAHEHCPGANDPSYILPCVAVPAVDGSAPVPPVAGPDAAQPPGPADPVAAAQQQLTDVAGAVAVIDRRLEDGSVEIAFLDDDGRAVRTRTHPLLEDGTWGAGEDWVCPAATLDPATGG